MGFGEMFMFALGLSMDAFAVSVCKGLSVKKGTLKAGAVCGAWFGSFQALMPLIGFLLGSLFAKAIESFDHWIAFGLLAFIGINMLRDAFDSECEIGDADLSFKAMFVMAIATSIDAMAVGISMAMAGNVNIYIAVALIGVVTFAMSALGVKIGNVFGCKFQKKAQVAGGVILIALGIKILLEHLGIFS